MQQGYPLGSVLFALEVDSAIRTLGSPLNLWFLDDGTLAGPIETIAADIHKLISSLRKIGLEINTQKFVAEPEAGGSTCREQRHKQG